MAHRIIPLGAEIVSGLTFDEPGGAVWFATADGGLGAYLLHHERLSAHGAGWADVRALLPTADGLALAVASAAGLHLIPRAGADAGGAPQVTFPAPVVAAARLPAGEVLVLDADGAVHRVMLPAATTTPLLVGPAGATQMLVDPAADALVLLVPGTGTTSLHRFALADGSPLGAPLDIPQTLAALAPGPGAAELIVAAAAGDLRRIAADGTADPAATLVLPGTTALARWHSLVMAAAGPVLRLAEWGEDAAKIPVAASFRPLVPGGWVPVTVDFTGAGIAPDDVTWKIAEGPHAATLSLARPADGGLVHEYRVIAGPQAMEITLVGSWSGSPVVTRRFRIMALWPDPDLGPPMALTGAQRVYPKPGWGGGPAGPQNIDIHKAPEVWRIAACVFRVRGTASSVDAGQRIADLTRDILGPDVSARRYYEEVSYRATGASTNPAHPRGTTIELLGGEVFGPIDIDMGWGDLFEPSDKDNPWSAWNPKSSAWDVLAGTFSTFLLDKGLADTVTRRASSVLMMVLPASDDPVEIRGTQFPAFWCWAFANDAQVYWKDTFSATFKRIPAVVMPAAQPANIPSPWGASEYASTIIHELGHNLGCPDLYDYGTLPAEITGRVMGDWDIMHADVPLPHFSLAHRMRLGWVHPDWIEACDFGTNPASRTVTLQATESLTRSGPPAGRKAGVEVRIRDGWNYYFEYRRRQAGQIGDQSLPASNAVLGSDVAQPAADEMERPLIMLLPDDVDGDGPVLRLTGRDYEESDVTDPDRMHDFRITRRARVAGDPDAVKVDIEYIGAHRAELAITPAPGHGNYKSPDIDLDGPFGPNVAVKGKTNTIKVRVHNRGTKAADAVQVRVAWLPFTTAPGGWNALPLPDTQPIPAHSTREFTLDWALPASVPVGDAEAEHFCVRVDIDRYVDPTDPAGSEIVVHNNWAQSNFNTAAVGHASPSERRRTAVSATNKLPMAAVHKTLVEQDDPNFRAYVDHAWRRLAPGEIDVSDLAYESLAGDPLFDGRFQLAFRKAARRGLVNTLTARTFITPERPWRDGPIARWGVELAVKAGLATFIRDFGPKGRNAVGRVLAGNPAQPWGIDGGRVRLVCWLPKDPGKQWTADGTVSDGTFVVLMPLALLGAKRMVLMQAFYHGTASYCPCMSAVEKWRP